MKSTGQLEWNDYWNAWELEHGQWALARTVILLVVFGILGLAALVVYANATNKGNPLEYALWFIPAMILSVLLFLVPQWNQRQQLKMAFDQDKRIKVPFDVEMSDTQLSMSSEIGHSDYPWNHFRKWNADENVVLLYITDTAPLILPVRVLGDAKVVQFLKDKLAQNQIPRSSKLRNRPLQTVIAWGVVVVAILLFLISVMPELFRFGS